MTGPTMSGEQSGERRRGRKSLSQKQVHAIVMRRLGRIDGLSFLESFAMFMGKAQLVELGLKNILTEVWL
jgi:hypothetical protein